MSTTQWLLNICLLAWVLLRNLGPRPVTRTTYVVPLLVVIVAAVTFLRDLPTAGGDGRLELVGVALGLAFGVLATYLTRIRRSGESVVISAGAAFATLWLVVIGSRVAFAEWATHSGARTVGEFSMRHQIDGAAAWTAAFVLMALAMVLGRTLSTAVVVRRTASSVSRRGELASLA